VYILYILYKALSTSHKYVPVVLLLIIVIGVPHHRVVPTVANGGVFKN
jgi:hypothetical protein